MNDNYSDFIGGFKSFYDLTTRTFLIGKVITFWIEQDGRFTSITKRVIGFTNLPNDIMLHVIDAAPTTKYNSYEEQINAEGIQFLRLSYIFGIGGMLLSPLNNKDEEEEKEIRNV